MRRLAAEQKILGSSTSSPHCDLNHASGPVAQWIRHRPTEPGIAGSSPAGVILLFKFDRKPALRHSAMPHGARADHIAAISKSRIHDDGKCKQLALAGATAAIAQLGERQTEDLKVPGSIPGLGTFFRL